MKLTVGVIFVGYSCLSQKSFNEFNGCFDFFPPLLQNFQKISLIDFIEILKSLLQQEGWSTMGVFFPMLSFVSSFACLFAIAVEFFKNTFIDFVKILQCQMRVQILSGKGTFIINASCVHTNVLRFLGLSQNPLWVSFHV